MSLPDRILCWIIGHTWEPQPPTGKGVWACPHCNQRVCDVQLSNWITRGLSTNERVAYYRWAGPPKRRW